MSQSCNPRFLESDPSNITAEQAPIEWNQTRKEYPHIPGLQQLVEAQVARTPDAIAAEFPVGFGVLHLSYRELNNRANQLAHWLRKRGVGPDQIVGISVSRSLDLLVGLLGIVKAGAAYVPFDPAYPRERLSFMIEDTKAPVILTQATLAASLPKGQAETFCLDSEWETVALESTENPPCQVGHDHLAYLIYTSGSTGRPKGVAMRQGPLINLLQWQMENFSFASSARTLQFASINFDVSFQEIFSTWTSGGTVVLISEEERRDSNVLIRFLENHRVERLFLPFVALKHLADSAEREGVYPKRLREVITAGEQLQSTPQIVQFFSKLSRCTLENQYGPSETHVVTAYRLNGEPHEWPALPSIGRPIANTQIRILDESRNEVPVGATGELYIGGVCLARGYLNRPELTAEKFVSDPFSSTPGARLYKTGDLARYLPDGNIEFLGRIDHQVKIRGHRIELGEIETILSQHPQVREAVATAHETAAGDRQLVAYVVAKAGKIGPGELRTFLKDRLAPYAIPSRFVSLEKLPLTPNGKVDRRALPDPEDSGESPETVKQAKDVVERQLQMIFERFFRRSNVGVDMNFFELGGDSLQALKLVLEIERVTGRKIPLTLLYQAPTIEGLARVLHQQSSDTNFSCLVPLQPEGKRRPLFLVHTTPGDVLGYGNLVHHLPHDRPCYAFQSLGLHQLTQRHRTLEEMAAHYVSLLRRQQPAGPYILGGWCYGGILAVEIAQQLIAAGQVVAPLLLIETPAPAAGWLFPLLFMQRIWRALTMSPRQWRGYIREKIRFYTGHRAALDMRFKRTDAESPNSGAEQKNELIAQLEEVYHTNLKALDSYKPRRYPGKIILFNAAEPDPGLVPDPLYGWRGLADNIQVHVIPGGHDTILMEPHAQTLAQTIVRCLDAEKI